MSRPSKVFPVYRDILATERQKSPGFRVLILEISSSFGAGCICCASDFFWSQISVNWLIALSGQEDYFF